MISLLRTALLVTVLLHASACARSAGKPTSAAADAVPAVPYGANAPASGTLTHDGVALYYEMYGDGPITNEKMTDDLTALIDHLQLDSVDVIGWSDGGIEAPLFGMQHPGKVRKLVDPTSIRLHSSGSRRCTCRTHRSPSFRTAPTWCHTTIPRCSTPPSSASSARRL